MDRRYFMAATTAVWGLGAAAAPTYAADRIQNSRYRAVAPARLSGLVLGPGPQGRCDDDKTGIGIPRWNETTQSWWLWYYCRSENYAPDLPPTLGTGRIAVATSKDGLAWDRIDGPLADGAVLEPSSNPDAFDCLHIGLTDVTYADGQWWMWYFGGDREPIDMPFGRHVGYRLRPGLAVSRDGLNWTKRPGPAHGGALVDTGNALYSAWHNALHADGKVYLYTSVTDGQLSRWDTLIYVSADGGSTWDGPTPLRWADMSPGYDGCGELTRHIVPNPFPTGERWLMIYTALDGDKARWQRRSHALAVSNDAMSWRHLYDRPVFEIGPDDAWDGGGVAAPQLVKAGEQWRLYYYAFPKPDRASELPTGTGLALAHDADLRKFTRFGGV